MVLPKAATTGESGSIGGKRKWSRYLFYLYKNRRAAGVAYQFAISGHTRDRAGRLFPGSGRSPIEVLHLGARARLEIGGNGTASDRKEKALPDGRVQCLYVGSFEARKNIDALLRHLPDILGTLPYDLHLVGHVEGERKRELESRISSAGLVGSVHLHGLVSDEELKSRYRSAHFLLFPTLFEGFGLPMVEAMSHGTVVCAFNNSCIPEVGGDAVILSENNDFAGWGKRVRELIAQPQQYAMLSRAALRRAEHFTEAGMLRRYSEYFDRVFAGLGPAGSALTDSEKR